MAEKKSNTITLPRPFEPAPDFTAREMSNDSYHFSTVAGRNVVLFFFGSRGNPRTSQMLDAVLAGQDRFNDHQACFFGVTVDPEDITKKRLQTRIPGIRYFLDFDFKVSRLYGAMREDFQKTKLYNPISFVLDPALRVLAIIPVESPEVHAEELFRVLDAQPAIETPKLAIEQSPPPVLIVPRIFEPELCERLIAYYKEQGSHDSGFMTEANGKTVLMVDHGRKRRSDCLLEDEELRSSVRFRILNRLVPEIKKAFYFQVTRMERYLIACYDGETGDYFSSHRDNTTKGTAHRRFAVSLALNTGEYEGGGLQLPEYSSRVYSPPTGGGLVFCCSLQHRAMPVRNGKRYMFLPFLYDDDAAQLREANLKYLDPDLRNDVSLGSYKAGSSKEGDKGSAKESVAGKTQDRKKTARKQSLSKRLRGRAKKRG